MIKSILITCMAIIVAAGISFLPGAGMIEQRDVQVNEPKDKITLSHVEYVSIKIIPVGCQAHKELFKQYDWDYKVAQAIMLAESQCNPDAVGDTWVIGGIYAPSCGLMQVRTLPGRPTCDQLKNPKTNLEWSYRLYKANGFQPWTMYNNGQYKKYL